VAEVDGKIAMGPRARSKADVREWATQNGVQEDQIDWSDCRDELPDSLE
jgi:hypothetical protein